MRLLPLLLVAACLQPVPENPKPPVMTAERALASTYQVNALAVGDGGAVFAWSGTAWAVAPGRLITAGHVCHEMPEGAMAFYSVTDAAGNRTDARILKRADEPDLCLLEADVPAPPLPLGDRPDYGTPVCYVGAPLAMWGQGRAPYFCGHTSGGDMVTAPTAPGA